MIRVLQNGLEWCRLRSTNGERVSMPFPKSGITSTCIQFTLQKYYRQNSIFPYLSHHQAVQLWIDRAKEQSGKNPLILTELGGTVFDAADPTTHWRTSAQFFTWFKNNVERRSKYEALLNDSRISSTTNTNEAQNIAIIQRAKYCQSIIALTKEIRALLRKRISHSAIPPTTTTTRYTESLNITPDGVDLLMTPLPFDDINE